MQVIPNQSYNREEARDCADDEAAVDQTEVFHVLVLLQEDLREKRADEVILRFSYISQTASGKDLHKTASLIWVN